MINLKEVIIQNLQKENERLHVVVNQLQKKIISLESKNNSVEQYGDEITLRLLKFLIEPNLTKAKIKKLLQMHFLDTSA